MADVISFPSQEEKPHYADVLSFMETRTPAGTGINHWVVKPSGHYGDDCEKGKALAIELLSFVGQNPTHGNFSVLAPVVMDMHDVLMREGRKKSGVEIGFLQEIGIFAFTAARQCFQQK